MPVHLLKIAVGIESVEHFEQRIAARAKKKQLIVHHTRHMPKRTEEVLGGGSLYWIVKGFIMVRMRILGLKMVTLPKEGPHCAIEMEPKLIPVVPTPRRPHQGWRYLEAEDAPRDLAKAGGGAKLPPKLAAELRELGLL